MQVFCGYVYGRRVEGLPESSTSPCDLRTHPDLQDTMCISLNTVTMLFRSFPPGRHFRFSSAGRVFLHMYQAHIAAYEAIKAATGAP